MTIATIMTHPKTEIRSLFPSRLKKRVPFWSAARTDMSCHLCGDDIKESSKIVVDPDTRAIACERCGTCIVGTHPDTKATKHLLFD